MSLHNYPGAFVQKDLAGRYIDISHYAVELVGWRKLDDALEKTDFDLPCPAIKYAERFLHLDDIASKQETPLTTLDFQHYHDGWHLLLSTRHPQNNGIMSFAQDVTHIDLFRSALFFLKNEISFLGNNLGTCYILGKSPTISDLTIRHQECLFYLMRGQSNKFIAEKLFISSRTVESYIAQMREQYHCKNRSQLIEYAINKGLFFNIPNSILRKELNVPL